LLVVAVKFKEWAMIALTAYLPAITPGERYPHLLWNIHSFISLSHSLKLTGNYTQRTPGISIFRFVEFLFQFLSNILELCSMQYNNVFEMVIYTFGDFDNGRPVSPTVFFYLPWRIFSLFER